MAGIDTVGSTLGFLIYELYRDTSLRDRVRSSVDACFDAHGGALPPVPALQEVADLVACVREALRLHPASFAVYRHAAARFEFCGHTVDEGRDVLVFTSSPHTDPRYFSDPGRFDIDRFLPPRNEHKQRGVFAPFGGGPHICLGAGMGEAQLVLSTALFLREFEFDVSPTRRLRRAYDPSLSPPRTFVARVRRRRAA